jgi:YHS domain-containing protein
MNKKVRLISLLTVMAIILVIGALAQQQSAETAVDPVCGMPVVKSNAPATFDHKGTTYYFCNVGCKEAFAKDPEKYLQAQAKGEKPMGGMGVVRHGQGQCMCQGIAKGMAHRPMMQGCPMGGRMMEGRKGMMPGGMGMPVRGMMGPGMGQLFMLYGDKIETVVENTKDGAMLKLTSKDPDVVKAIQVHMAEHMAMMKKMKDNAAKVPADPGAVKSPGEACCADCPMKKK